MFYDIIDKLDFLESDRYTLEKIDGQARYRWYKYALNSVYMISSIDDLRDIDNISFDDLGTYYDSVAWVAKNDPKALEYIMGTLTEPVTDIVKQKLLDNLQERKYYRSCAIVEKYLTSFPVPLERTFTRKKEKYTKEVNERIAMQVYQLSDLLVLLKTTDKEKLYKTKMKNALSKLLNFESFSDYFIREHLDSMEWLLKNTPDDLKEMFTVEICQETKDNFINYLAKRELYALCQFFSETVKVRKMSFYFEIPPYQKEADAEDKYFLPEDED